MEEMESSKLVVLEEGVDLAEVAAGDPCCKLSQVRITTE